MISWLKKLGIAFGSSFLWLVCFIYFTQGFRSFVWTAVSYLLKDKLKLSPSASQFVTSIAFFPWSIKPLYGCGSICISCVMLAFYEDALSSFLKELHIPSAYLFRILSDCIPIGGRKRIPYLIISTLLSLFPWLILGIDASSRTSRLPLMILLTVQNLGSAMADVVIDAMIAEAVRFERATFAGDLQSISWMAMAFGGICGSLIGGYTLNNIQIDKIFLLFSAFPAIQLLSCGLVEESSLDDDVLFEHSSSNGTSHLINGQDSDEDNLRSQKNISAKKSGKVKNRRKRGKKSAKQRPVTARESEVPLVQGFTVEKWLKSLKTATSSLLRAFRQPMILRPMTWFFLAHVTVPNMSTVMFYYQTETLKLEASFLGTTRVIGWLGLMLGTFTYNRYLKKMKLRNILLCAQIGLSILSILDGVLVSRSNLSAGISDKVMVLFGSALSDGINQFKFMPFLILSGQLCPPGIEGTLFALFMSINNLGSTVSAFLGAGLASILNISSGSFENLLAGIIVQVLCTLVPTAFLFLIPKEATGISA